MAYQQSFFPHASKQRHSLPDHITEVEQFITILNLDLLQLT